MAYNGPERRTVITFTREDSDRLVRLEQKLIDLDTKIDGLNTDLNTARSDNVAIYGRLNKAERKLSWITGIGTTVAFLITTGIAALKVIYNK